MATTLAADTSLGVLGIAGSPRQTPAGQGSGIVTEQQLGIELMGIWHCGLMHFSTLAPGWQGLEEDPILARFQDHLKRQNLPSKSHCRGQRII